MKLVDDWRKAKGWISVQCMLVGAAVQGAWVFIPPDMKSSIPPDVVQYATLALFALGIIGRVIQQTPPACPDKPEEDPKP